MDGEKTSLLDHEYLSFLDAIARAGCYDEAVANTIAKARAIFQTDEDHEQNRQSLAKGFSKMTDEDALNQCNKCAQNKMGICSATGVKTENGNAFNVCLGRWFATKDEKQPQSCDSCRHEEDGHCIMFRLKTDTAIIECSAKGYKYFGSKGPSTRTQTLDLAKQAVTVDRAATHGDIEDNFTQIADLWSARLGIDIGPHQVAIMMIDLKTVRAWGNPKHLDSWTDCAGYSACGAEIARAE